MKEDCIAAFRWSVFRFFRLFPSGPSVPASDPPGYASSVLPAAGALAGFLIWGAVSLVRAAAGSAVSILFAGLIVPLVMEFLTGWTGFRALASFLELRRRGRMSAMEILRADWSRIPSSGEPAEQVVPVTVYLFRCGLYAILASAGGGVWFLFAWTGSFLIRAELSRLPDPETGHPVMPVPGEYSGVRYDILLAGGIFLAAGILSWNPFRALAGFAAALLLAWWFIRIQKRACGTTDDSRLSFYGACGEFALLFLGAVLS